MYIYIFESDLNFNSMSHFPLSHEHSLSHPILSYFLDQLSVTKVEKFRFRGIRSCRRGAINSGRVREKESRKENRRDGNVSSTFADL